MLISDPTARLAAALAVLEGALDEIGQVALADVSGTALGRLAERALVIRRRADATAAGLASQFQRTGDWFADGAKSAHGWLTGGSNESWGSMRAVIEHGRTAETFPMLAAAWAEGAVGVRHMAIVAQAYAKHGRLQEAMVEADEAITALARDLAPKVFEARLTALCYRFDPESVDEAEKAKQKDAWLHVSRLMDGMVKVDGQLDAVTGAKFVQVLEAMGQAIRKEADPADPEPFGPDPLEGEGRITDYRCQGERNVEALARLCDTAASVTGDDGLPLIATIPPQVSVTIPLDSLLAEGHERDVAMGWLDHHGVPTTPLTPATCRQVACDASLRPLVVDREGNLVAMLPAVRSIHPALHKAIRIRDVHCRFPRCRSRIDHLHHLKHYRHGGLTTADNLVGLCHFHHRHLHANDWATEGHPAHELVFRDKQGATVGVTTPLRR